MNSTALIFIAIFWVLIIIPCIGVGVLGHKAITQLGNQPSKTPFIQMSIVIKLVFIEVVTFALLLAFFKALTGE